MNTTTETALGAGEKAKKPKELSKNAEGNNLNRQGATAKLAKMSMLAAISIVLVALIHFPILPAAPFLEYDPADIPILIGTFAFGPLAGLMLVAVVSVIQGVTVSSASGIYGIIMHIIATGTLVSVSGLIYKKHKNKKVAIIGLVAGVIVMTLIMVPANLLVTPYYMGMPVGVVKDLIIPAILPFNFIKAAVNAIITFLLYKRISKFLHK